MAEDKKGAVYMKINRQTVFTLLVLVGIFYLALPDDLLARAGGGGSYSSGGYSSSSSGSNSGEGSLISLLIAAPVTLVSMIASFFGGIHFKQWLDIKNKTSRDLLEKLDDSDPIWDINNIKARIEKIYFAVQDAWTKRNQKLAREYMSERIYDKHKRQTDNMKQNGLINKLERINLEDIKIIGVFDAEDDDKDRLKAVIYGGMVDYMWDEKTQQTVSGKQLYESFREVWNFIRQGDEWVLDEIEQTVDTQSLKNTKVYSHLMKSFKQHA